MIHPIPPGTRDVLPAEMREMRRLQGALGATFERFGYGEVATPTIEYHEVLGRGDARGAPAAYRFFDEHGELLAMRSDMTIPIARLVSSRFESAEPPFRFCYFATAYRGVRPQRGQMREFMQAGIDEIGTHFERAHVEAARTKYRQQAQGNRRFSRACHGRCNQECFHGGVVLQVPLLAQEGKPRAIAFDRERRGGRSHRISLKAFRMVFFERLPRRFAPPLLFQEGNIS